MPRRSNNTSWEKRSTVPFHANHLTEDASWYFTKFELDEAQREMPDYEALEDSNDFYKLEGSIGYIFASGIADENWKVTDYKMKKDLQCAHTRSVADIVREPDGSHDNLVLYIDNPDRVSVSIEKSILHYVKGSIGEDDCEQCIYIPEVRND